MQDCHEKRRFLNKPKGAKVHGHYPVLAWMSPDRRRIPFTGSTDTVTAPSRICSSRSPINSRRQPRISGKSGVVFFSFA